MSKAIKLLKEIKAVISWWKGKESRSSQVQYLVCQVEAELEKQPDLETRIKELEYTLRFTVKRLERKGLTHCEIDAILAKGETNK